MKEQPDHPKLREMFAKAVELPVEQRSQFLDEACGAAADLRQQVESLLSALERAGSDFLTNPTVGGDPSPDAASSGGVSEGPGSQIGRYKLLEQIGEGGFGCVFMAEQVSPVRRIVALKIIKPGMDSRQVIARFEAERQALAMMDHPNIAHVFDAGATETGQPYFVMELVRGIPITDYCDQNKLSTKERLELFITVCSAVQHAHQKGIIHRDIKPTNVLVTLNEGVAVPKVIDFGVAKATGQQLTEKTLFTNFAQMIGTPLYMSPEQAEMTCFDVDTRSDIYSLGVLLYELLTGTTPLDKDRLKQAAFDEIRRIIREEEPPPPSTRLSTMDEKASTISAAQRKSDPKTLGHLMRGEMDWIVMKALEKQRSRRYETANGLARDLERYLRDEAVEACPPSSTYRLKKFVRRNKGSLVTAGLLALVLLLASVISTWQALRATHAEREVSRERDQVQAALAQKQDALAQSTRSEREAREQLAVQLIAVGDAALATGQSAARDNYREARDIARELGSSQFPADLGLLASYESQPAPLMGSDGSGGGVGGFHGHTGWANVAFMADGRHAVSTGWEGSIIVWDVPRGVPLQKFPGVGQHTNRIALSPDGRRLLTADDDSNLRLWDLASGELLRTFVGHLHRVESVAFSPDGQRALSGADDDKTLRLWNIETGQELLRMEAAPRYVVAVAFSPDGRRALSGGDVGVIVLWDLETGRAIHRMSDGSGSDIASVCFSPDGQTALSASFNHVLLLWDLAAGKPLRTFNGHPAPIESVQFSPDGRTALSGCDDRTVRLWDVASGRQMGIWYGHQAWVRSVSFSPDGRMGLTADSSGAIKLWDLRDPNATAGFRGHTDRVYSLAASTDNRILLSGSRDKTARLWDVATGLPLVTLEAGQIVRGVALAPDCRSALSSHEDGTLALWDLRTASRLRTLQKHDDIATSVAFLPDGKRAISSSNDKTLKLWDLQQGTAIRTFTGHKDMVVLVVVSPDGRTALSASRDQTASLWDIETGQVLHTFTGHTHWVHCVSFSPDGRWAASGGYDRRWALWDVATGRNIFLKQAGADVVFGVAFSPDGKFLATASREANIGIGLWDLTNGTHVRDLYHLQQPFEAASNAPTTDLPVGVDHGLNSLAFLRDGVTLLAGERDGTIRRWQLDRPARFDEFAKSLPQAREALERNPNDAAALAVFGRWYAFRGVYDWAAEFLEKSREHGADVSSLELARLYWQLGRRADATREFDRAIEKKEAPQDYLELCRSAVQNPPQTSLLSVPSPRRTATTFPATAP